MAAISVDNLQKSFGTVKAVDIHKLDIEKGDFLGLVGNNGAGKTTFLRLLLDLTKADEGSVTLEGVNPRLSEEWKTFTGAYLDDGFLIDFLTPDEYFAFIASANGIDAPTLAERRSDFQAFLGDGITGQKKYIRSYSAGNKQKIGIVSAMLNHPQVLILDEPFNFLDPGSQEELKRLLTTYQQSTGSTIILSSHNLQHVAEICRRICIMDAGHIVEDIDNNDGKATEELRDYFKR